MCTHVCVIEGTGESGALTELALGTWTPTQTRAHTHIHTQLRCIPVLIRAGNKAVLLEEKGKKTVRGKGGRKRVGREEKKKRKRF